MIVDFNLFPILSCKWKMILMALVAVYPNCVLYIESFWDWAPYLAAVLAVGTVINIRLGYRRFQQLEMVLQFTPKVL